MKSYQFNTYHTFVIQVDNRDKLINYLKKNNITTEHIIRLFIFICKTKYLNYKKGSLINTELQAKKIITLPINQFLSSQQIKFICKNINKFFDK